MKILTQNMLGRLLVGVRTPSAPGMTIQATDPELFHGILMTASARTQAPGTGLNAEAGALGYLAEIARMSLNRAAMDAFSPGDDGGTDGIAIDWVPGFGPVEPPASKDGRPRQVSAPKTLPANLDGIVDRASAAYGVDRRLIVSVIRAESGFDPNATSPKGAMGLMQLMPQTARELGVADPYDPEQNVMGGTRYLRGLLDRYAGDVEKALAAYNWGAGNLERGTALPRETRDYIARVLGDYLAAGA